MATKKIVVACLMALASFSSGHVINHDGHPSAATPTTTKAPPTTTVRAATVCTSTATATWFATSGCDIPCGNQVGCIADYAVVVPCGCDRVSVTVTTTTVCPKASPCVQCHTGWGIATQYLPCPTKPISAPPPPPVVTSVMPT